MTKNQYLLKSFLTYNTVAISGSLAKVEKIVGTDIVDIIIAGNISEAGGRLHNWISTINIESLKKYSN